MLRAFILSVSLFTVILTAEVQRTEIGQRAYISIVDEDIKFLARIDSGARITSLHAMNIRLEGPKAFIYAKKPEKLLGVPFHKKEKNEEYKRNIGRMISFTTYDEKGKQKRLQARVLNIAKVRNAQGVEYRYVVRLGLKYKNIIKYKEVNLRDRSSMSYKLLIGRNWLDDDFVIKTDMDVEKITY